MTRRPHRLAHSLVAAATLLAGAVLVPATASATTIHVPGLGSSSGQFHAMSTGAAATSLVVTATPGTVIPGATALSADGSQFRVSIPRTDSAAAQSVLNASSAVKSVESDANLAWSDYQLNGYSNDPMSSQEWALDAIGWHRITLPASSPTIAFLDSGLDVSHPDIAGTVASGAAKIALTYNAVDGSTDVTDEFGHGTGTASIASALTNNGVGIASVAPGSQIMEIKVGGMQGVELSDAVRGLNYAVANGAKIVNMSFGSPDASPALAAAVANAINHNVVVVAAAGNDGCAAQGGGNETNYPAAYPHVIAVAASDQSSHIACFSNYGPEVALAAPGVDIQLAASVGSEAGTLENPSGYQNASGTSFSAPIVSGAVALLLAAHPNMTPDQVRFALMATATDVGPKGWDPHAGAGILNLSALLAYAGPLPVDSQESNDDIVQARAISPLLSNSRHGASIRAMVDQHNDASDVYAVVLTRHHQLTVTLRGPRGLTLTLWKPSTRTVQAAPSRRGALIAASSSTGKLKLVIPAGGTYFLQVSGARATSNYKLTAIQH